MYATTETLLPHYVMVAKMDRDYAIRRVKYIAERAPSLYADLPRLLTEAMNSIPKSPAAKDGLTTAPAASCSPTSASIASAGPARRAAPISRG